MRCSAWCVAKMKGEPKPMAVNANQKGKRGEREVAALLREHGYDARRGQQHSGSPDSPDVVHNIGGFHIEVKRTERFRLYDALEQAHEDAGPLDVPVVFHRMSGREWVVIMTARDFLEMVKEKSDA